MVDAAYSEAALGLTSPQLRAPAAEDSADVFSGSRIAVLCVVLTAIAAIPIILHPWPPISDYINHLARMYVIASANSDPDLARFYEVDWQLIPNLMMDLIVPLMARIMNIYLAGQIYTIGCFALILSGTVALHRQLYGRWSALPLIAAPLLYNNVFLVGTMNYVFGIGLALWAMAAWIRLRESSALLRFSISTLFVLALYLCHLFAVGVYGLALLAYELRRLWTEYARLRALDPACRPAAMLAPLLVDFVACGLPFLPVLPMLMMSPTWGLRQTVTWELPGKFDGLTYVIEVYSHGAAFVLVAAIAFAIGWTTRHRALSFHSFGLLLLALGAVAYMLLPRVLFETYMADTRLPISLAFMLIACIDLDFKDQVVRRGFAAVLIIMLAMRVAEVENMWAGLSVQTDSFRQSVQLVDRGSKVLVAYADPDGGDASTDLGLVHADCLAIIERSALVTTAFTVVGKQIMHARPEYRERVDTVDGTPPGINELVRVAKGPDGTSRLTKRQDTTSDIYWKGWTKDYDYLYVLFVDDGFQNPDPTHLTELFVGERFVLYRIDSSQIADAGKPTN